MSKKYQYIFIVMILLVSIVGPQYHSANAEEVGIITTIAGDGTLGIGGDGGPATSAPLTSPFQVAVDSVGNIYIAEAGNHRIRKVDTGGNISTIAGTGAMGNGGDGITATGTQLNIPSGVAVDNAGNIYIADTGNHRIRKVGIGGTITTIAGTGIQGNAGDEGPATSAQLNMPQNVVVDNIGNVYIADMGNHRIRKVDTGGTITTIAGMGIPGSAGDEGAATDAQLMNPQGITVDSAGNVYIADTGNHRIRKVDTGGTITTIAGTGIPGSTGDEGAATSAQLSMPSGVAIDSAGNVYISDAIDQRIRKVDTGGIITTIAGTGIPGSTGDGGAATSAQLSLPMGVAVDSIGNIYITDLGNSKIRKVTMTTVTTVPDAPTNVTAVAGDGQATVGFTVPTNDGGSIITGYKVKVYVNDNEQPTLETTGTTNSIIVSGLTNGTAYTFTVVAINDKGDSMESMASDAVTPNPAPLTDEQAVAQAALALEIGYATGDSAAIVTQPLTLPTTGIEQTNISWSSSQQLIVKPNGEVTRPLVGDSMVTLTATITKGSATKTKSFTVTVKGVNVPPVPEITPPFTSEGSSTGSTMNPTSEQFVVNVQSGDGKDISKTIINRTTNTDGTVQDRVTLTAQSTTEALRKLQENNINTMRIMLPTDTVNRVQQTDIVVVQPALTLLKAGQVHLEIVADGAKIAIPQNSLQSFEQELYFRVVPVKAQTTQQQLEERAKAETSVQQFTNNATITLLGQPMTIETNMQNRPVTLTLPLPQNVTQEQLNNLAVYIEHSDGTKEVVRGKVVDFKAGIRGIEFEVTKFSTFSILYAPVKQEQPKEEVVVEEQISTPYIKGYADGTFRPEASVTRAQMASMLARYLTDNEIPEITATFIDTATHDVKDAIEFVKEVGLFKGTTATTFNPNGSITRAQMATVVARWLAENGEVANSQAKVFKDVKGNYWAAEAIATVSAQGIMTGTSTTTFNPEGYLTRAQAVKVLNRLFERQVTAIEQTPLFTDVPSNHWAFDEIQAAAQ
ncbi:NHL domain-containing protein [Lysinibacillus piscis]|uniref:Uncharacterized protein n=1 Tax=Lysinibacillus piscis TaxID=2518931 RepID=A0ABQ5NHC1_9BACI|nr:S-layer homology domain-containing protein [Lysinibacillus sp. KH24]GLC87751.1 hypothetical protein LYSBPC_08780 [Lysinibacillus sp. KH24]